MSQSPSNGNMHQSQLGYLRSKRSFSSRRTLLLLASLLCSSFPCFSVRVALDFRHHGLLVANMFHQNGLQAIQRSKLGGSGLPECANFVTPLRGG